MKKRNSTIDRTIAEHLSVERYEFYRTAILFYSRFTAYGNDTFFSIRSFSSESLLQREDVLAIDAFVAHLVHNLTDEEDAEAAYLALFG